MGEFRMGCEKMLEVENKKKTSIHRHESKCFSLSVSSMLVRAQRDEWHGVQCNKHSDA